MSENDATDRTAEYVFRVTFRVRPIPDDTTIEPDQFDTVLHREAQPPGQDGWLFFRDHLWRGELGDSDHFRTLTEEALGVRVTSVSFSALRTSEAYLDALRTEIESNLEEFRAETAREALSKYLGSSIRVVPGSE